MSLATKIEFRCNRSDKRLAERLARRERRTVSNFMINLIHERQALVNTLTMTEVRRLPEPTPVVQVEVPQADPIKQEG